ncbi:MAG: S-layer protein, partial [Phycisphaerales bacterium]|nr:S-layer protein [Phycisphaerales bacterium]
MRKAAVVIAGLTLGSLEFTAFGVRASRAAPAAPTAPPSTAPATRPTEVVERFPDGSPRAKYGADAQGRRDGKYEEFFPGGKPRFRGAYAAGQKVGSWLTYEPGGRLVESVVFGRAGVEGPYAWTAADGSASFKATYAGGGLSGQATAADAKGKIVRTAVYPRPLAEIRKQWAALWPAELTAPKFLEEPAVGPPAYRAGKVAPESLEQALKVTRLYRYLSGVPWQNVVLSPSDTVEAQHGAVILQKIGSLTHTPAKPDGMDDAFFKLAYAGCHKGNIHQGQTHILSGIRGFMDDSDASNIAGIGHRRWILFPGLRRVGFGWSGGFMTMHVIDGSHDIPAFQYVAFPGEGYYPRQLVEPHYAWSVHLHPSRATVPDAGELKVRVVRLDDRLQPTGAEAAARVVSVLREPGQ